MVGKYKEGDEVLIEWLPGDVRDAIVISILGNRYMIGINEGRIEALVEEDAIIPKQSKNLFFGG